jgi:hypothetical protein
MRHPAVVALFQQEAIGFEPTFARRGSGGIDTPVTTTTTPTTTSS